MAVDIVNRLGFRTDKTDQVMNGEPAWPGDKKHYKDQ